MKTRLLIVDDEEEFVQALSERLIIRDYDVTTSLDGDDAIEKVMKYNFDVIILDVRLPGIDGVDVLKRIKEIKPISEVIMLTGHATVETAIEGMKFGAYDYLMKPCETEELISKITGAHEKKVAQEERIRAAKVRKIISSPRSALKSD